MLEEERIKQVLYKFEDGGLVSKDIDQVLECLGSQFVGIGIGEQGFVRSVADVRAVYATGLKENDRATHALVYDQVEVLVMQENFGVVCAEITVLSTSGGELSKSKLSQSLSMIKEAGEWKICGLHASTAVVTDEGMAAYPLKFAEKTMQSLREKIGEEAFMVEEQYRQAVLADTIAFYIINFSLDIFEKCQLNSDWCSYVEPGMPFEKFMQEQIANYLAEEDRAPFLQCFSKENIQQAFYDKVNEISYEYRMRIPDGSYVWVISVLRLITDIVTGHKKGIMYVKNIDQKKRDDMLILNRATFDDMTGVYNKGTIINSITNLLAYTEGVFFMLDIDNFKHINDTWGHPVGDAVLIAVANVLKATFPMPSLIGRVGGDEFCVFSPNQADQVAFKAQLNALLEHMRQMEILEDGAISITCSIGATYCQREATFERIYKQADSALYLSKNNGKDRFSWL